MTVYIPAYWECNLVDGYFFLRTDRRHEFFERRRWVPAQPERATTTWNLHVDEKLRRDLPDGSARVKILGASGAYKVDWWSSEPGEDWVPVERGEFDDIEEPSEVSHLA
ncbi:hypothetical protein SAMN05216226_1332 [Halovenus aranensis]|uniref:Uncharacterized protein n=1 Tax=Halovenus aranensis TaxID=890420 RepID=A0A1G8ZRM9_9EURY|nr:hypothetical protein SAMN05216226_1332 [Halovenus aranensis]